MILEEKEKPDREIVKKQKELEAKIQKEAEKKAEKESIKHNAEFYRQFINDERYEPYKVLLEAVLRAKIELRNTLKDRVKTVEEYNLQSLFLDGQIQQIRDILTIPETFIMYAEELEKEK